MNERFTTRQVAKIVELSEAKIRSLARAGVVSPSDGADGAPLFSFQDLLLLRTTKGLLEAEVGLPRVRKILSSLRRQLPAGQQISSVKIYADGRRVVVWDGAARWQPDSGQFLLDFEARSLAAEIDLPVPKRRRRPALDADDWFELGIELEKTSPEEAMHAYRQAILLDGSLADAHLNLGRLLQHAKDRTEAESHYRQAIRYAPADALGHYNLGVLLDESGRAEEAIAAYSAAIEYDPELADAHYNLALLYEMSGRRPKAIRHFRAARKLYGR